MGEVWRIEGKEELEVKRYETNVVGDLRNFARN